MGSGARGGLSRPMLLFIVIDALLVLTFLILLGTIGVNPGGGTTDEPSTPAATSTASADPQDVDDVAFALPSGNIACTMGAGGVRCTIASYTYSPPTVPGCSGTVGHAVALDAEGFRFTCEDGTPGVASSDVPVLEYGEQESVGGWTCGSGTDGVTCTDAEGVGFRLARAQWTEVP
ncbi:hypothetical protein [Cellulomonas sp. SLBN-39]|uniref:hypothetical protein n=1 Tax=Cellulomonas sp. SLBN-39 TaxID=2768446 RepID=UPI001168A3CD|nr:hypothetical protein [Cellulomonas sp. SLBN-39]TQL00974.1 hypothetical protein FBY24_0012 [Cellulomonas sp. SLBN-39]